MEGGSIVNDSGGPRNHEEMFFVIENQDNQHVSEIVVTSSAAGSNDAKSPLVGQQGCGLSYAESEQPVDSHMNISADIQSPAGLFIHETPEKLSRPTPTSVIMSTPTKNDVASPMKISSLIQSPTYLLRHVVSPTTPIKQHDAVQVYTQPLNHGKQIQVIRAAKSQRPFCRKPQIPPHPANFPQTGPLDFSNSNSCDLRNLNKNSIKIEKNGSVKVVPGTNISYRTPGAHNRNKRGKIKRPMNAFMCWARSARAYLCHKLPTSKNADISIKLGQIWASMTQEQKRPYYDEAEAIKRKHREQFPDWIYQPNYEKKTEIGGDIKIYDQWKLQQQHEAVKNQILEINSKQQACSNEETHIMEHRMDAPAGMQCGDAYAEDAASKKQRKLHKNSYALKIRGLQDKPMYVPIMPNTIPAHTQGDTTMAARPDQNLEAHSYDLHYTTIKPKPSSSFVDATFASPVATSTGEPPDGLNTCPVFVMPQPMSKTQQISYHETDGSAVQAPMDLSMKHGVSNMVEQSENIAQVPIKIQSSGVESNLAENEHAVAEEMEVMAQEIGEDEQQVVAETVQAHTHKQHSEAKATQDVHVEAMLEAVCSSGSVPKTGHTRENMESLCQAAVQLGQTNTAEQYQSGGNGALQNSTLSYTECPEAAMEIQVESVPMQQCADEGPQCVERGHSLSNSKARGQTVKHYLTEEVYLNGQHHRANEQNALNRVRNQQPARNCVPNRQNAHNSAVNNNVLFEQGLEPDNVVYYMAPGPSAGGQGAPMAHQVLPSANTPPNYVQYAMVNAGAQEVNKNVTRGRPATQSTNHKKQHSRKSATTGPSPTPSGSSLANMNGFMDDARNLHSFSSGETQAPWPLPFAQHPYDDYINRQAQLYEAQSRPYGYGGYGMNPYGWYQPTPYFQRDGGYWCEDFDQDIPDNPSYFCNSNSAYWPPSVPNVPELDMNRWIYYMNDGRHSPATHQLNQYQLHPNTVPRAPSRPGTNTIPASGAPHQSARTQSNTRTHHDKSATEQYSQHSTNGLESTEFCQAVMNFCAPVENGKITVEAVSPPGSAQELKAEIDPDSASPRKTNQTPTADACGKMNPPTTAIPAASGQADQRAAVGFERVFHNASPFAAMPHPSPMHPYTQHNMAGNFCPPMNMNIAPNISNRSESAFRAFYAPMPQPGCDVHRVNYNDCNAPLMYSRDGQYFPAQPPNASSETQQPPTQRVLML